LNIINKLLEPTRKAFTVTRKAAFDSRHKKICE